MNRVTAPLELAINQESEGHHDGGWLILHPEVHGATPDVLA